MIPGRPSAHSAPQSLALRCPRRRPSLEEDVCCSLNESQAWILGLQPTISGRKALLFMAHSAVARVLSESSARSLQRVANRGSRRKPYSIGSGRRALTTFGASARSTAASQSHAPRWGTGLAICTSLATLYWTSSLQWHILPVALAESAPTSHAELDESFVHRKSHEGASGRVSPSLTALRNASRPRYEDGIPVYSVKSVDQRPSAAGWSRCKGRVSFKALHERHKLIKCFSSFLRVQVYSVGSYFAPDALKRLKGKQAVRSIRTTGTQTYTS